MSNFYDQILVIDPLVANDNSRTIYLLLFHFICMHMEITIYTHQVLHFILQKYMKVLLKGSRDRKIVLHQFYKWDGQPIMKTIIWNSGFYQSSPTNYGCLTTSASKQAHVQRLIVTEIHIFTYLMFVCVYV